ncbi:MAG: hypothetical protein ACHQRM_12350 [Bacteroidia bacterium]
MKNHGQIPICIVRIVSLFILISFLLTSCSVQKRLYTGGYYIDRSAARVSAPVHAIVVSKPVHIKDSVREVIQVRVLHFETTKEAVFTEKVPYTVATSLGRHPQVNQTQGPSNLVWVCDTLKKVKSEPGKRPTASQDSHTALGFLIMSFMLGLFGLIIAFFLARRSLRKNKPGPDFDLGAYHRAKTVKMLAVALFFVYIALLALFICLLSTLTFAIGPIFIGMM